MTYKVHPAYFPLVHDSHGYLVISLTRSGDIPSSPSSPDLAINSLLSARICFPPYTLRRLSLHISTINLEPAHTTWWDHLRAVPLVVPVASCARHPPLFKLVSFTCNSINGDWDLRETVEDSIQSRKFYFSSLNTISHCWPCVTWGNNKVYFVIESLVSRNNMENIGGLSTKIHHWITQERRVGTVCLCQVLKPVERLIVKDQFFVVRCCEGYGSCWVYATQVTLENI